MYAEFLLSREQSNRFIYTKVHQANIGLHFHSQLEFYLIESGEMEVWINGYYKKMKAGDISLAFSFDAHAYRTTKECTAYVVIIPTDLCPDILSELQHKRPRIPFINAPELYKLIQNCCEEIKKEPRSITSRGYLYVMLGTLLKKTELTELSEPMETDRITRLLFYVNDHFHENLTLSDVARQFGYSASYLSRHFKTTFQIGFS